MIPSVNVKVLENPIVEMIDARDMAVIHILCRCKECGEDYTICLQQRVQCGQCSLKESQERRTLHGWRWLKHFLGIDQWIERRQN